MHHGDWNQGWASGWWWLPMVIMMIAFAGGLVWLAVMLLRHSAYSNSAAPAILAADRRATPEEILGERLARGELDSDDYLQRLDALRPSSTP